MTLLFESLWGDSQVHSGDLVWHRGQPGGCGGLCREMESHTLKNVGVRLSQNRDPVPGHCGHLSVPAVWAERPLVAIMRMVSLFCKSQAAPSFLTLRLGGSSYYTFGSQGLLNTGR